MFHHRLPAQHKCVARRRIQERRHRRRVVPPKDSFHPLPLPIRCQCRVTHLLYWFPGCCPVGSCQIILSRTFCHRTDRLRPPTTRPGTQPHVMDGNEEDGRVWLSPRPSQTLSLVCPYPPHTPSVRHSIATSSAGDDIEGFRDPALVWRTHQRLGPSFELHSLYLFPAGDCDTNHRSKVLTGVVGDPDVLGNSSLAQTPSCSCSCQTVRRSGWVASRHRTASGYSTSVAFRIRRMTPCLPVHLVPR
jgi:hypothetical protein